MIEVGKPVKVKVEKATVPNAPKEYLILKGMVVDVVLEDGQMMYEIQLTEAVDGLKVGFRFEATEDQVKVL